MKRILFIAEHAYPIKSSESICNSKVAYTLAKAGYKVDVFTCIQKGTYESDNVIDSKLQESENLNIYKIETKNAAYFLSKSKSIFENLKVVFSLLKMKIKTGYFYNGMAVAHDILCAIKEHEKKFTEFPYDVIITRAYRAELAAIYLKEKYNIKWIANWNDPYPGCRFPKPYGAGPNSRIDFGYKRVYNKVRKLVDLHTFPSERLKNYMINSFKTVNPNKTVVIPHMAHSELLTQLDNKKDNKCLKFVSCGSVSYPRNPALFITALKNIVSEMNLSDEDIKCYFVGEYDTNLANIIKEKKLDGIVELLGSKKYTDCLEFITSCNLSLIIEAQCEEGIYLPTKFADAVQCRVPVFCVSPNKGTLHDMVDKYHNGYYCDNESIKSIESALRQAIIDYKNNQFPIVSKSNMEYFFEDRILEQFNAILL